jgi:hypothetical protein
VSFILVVSVVLNFIIGHGITSLVDCFVVGCVPTFLFKIYSIKGFRQCEPVGCGVIGESYHHQEWLVACLVGSKAINMGLGKLFVAFAQLAGLQDIYQVFRDINHAIEWLEGSSNDH